MERRARAHAKLNLTLRVLAREESGFHSIETVLLRLDLADEVGLRVVGDEIALRVSGDPSVPADERNLCWRAARVLGAGESGAGVEIRLRKRIPAGAGLGGGSADAAAVLRLLDSARAGSVGAAELQRMAGEIGSDVPFGLCPSHMAFAWERGRRLMPLRPPPPRPVLVLVPDFPIGAQEAYAWLAEDRASGSAPPPLPAVLPGAAELSNWDTLAGLASNDLEPPVVARRPLIGSLLDVLKEAGAHISLLCGSGSCVAGIFTEEAAREDALRAAAGWEGVDAISTHTLGPVEPLPG